MKFVLINPDYSLYGDPPLGLAYLAAYIKKKLPHIEVKIFDQLKEKEILKNIKKESPEMIGFPAVSQNYYKVKDIAKKIKQIVPASILVLGGVHVTTFPDSFKNSPFDIAVIGEGEIPIVHLLESFNQSHKLDLKKLSKIPGFIIRVKNKILNTGLSEQIANLDDIPLPARDLLNMKYYILPRFSSLEAIDPAGSILTSRGCPYACKFCSSSSFWGRRIRFFSAKRVVEEIEILYKKYGYRNIAIYDDLFSINKLRLRKIVKCLEEKNLIGKIKFSVYGRANCFDEETARLFKKMGVIIVTFGFETGSSRMLNYLKGDNVTIADNHRAIEICKKYGLDHDGFFMIGSPTETTRDLAETYNFIKENCPNNFIVYQTIAFPGTPFWDYAINNHIIKKDFYETKQKEFVDANSDLLLSKDIDPKEFIEYFNRIRSLYVNKNKRRLLKNIFTIRFRHIKPIFTLEFLRKAINLKGQLIKLITK